MLKFCCNSLEMKFIFVQCNGPKIWNKNFDDVIDQILTIDKRFKAFIKTKLISYLLPKSSRMKTKGSHFFNHFLYWVNQNPLSTLKHFSGQWDIFLRNIGNFSLATSDLSVQLNIKAGFRPLKFLILTGSIPTDFYTWGTLLTFTY